MGDVVDPNVIIIIVDQLLSSMVGPTDQSFFTEVQAAIGRIKMTVGQGLNLQDWEKKKAVVVSTWYTVLM